MNGGKWKLSDGDRHLHYSHATAADSYTPCPIRAVQVIPYWTFRYHMKKYLWKVTEMNRQGQRHAYKGPVIGWKRYGNLW